MIFELMVNLEGISSEGRVSHVLTAPGGGPENCLQGRVLGELYFYRKLFAWCIAGYFRSQKGVEKKRLKK